MSDFVEIAQQRVDYEGEDGELETPPKRYTGKNLGLVDRAMVVHSVPPAPDWDHPY